MEARPLHDAEVRFEESGEAPTPRGSPRAKRTLTVDEEAELLERLRSGDSDSFETLVRVYGPRMLATIRRTLGNADDASEAFQDALGATFRAIGRFELRARLGTWLERIAINAARMKRRTVGRRSAREVAGLPRLDDCDFPHPGALVSRPHDAVTRVEEAERRSAVHRCIARLPEIYRSAVHLRYIDGLGSREVSGALGITVNAAKLRLLRGRRVLRQCLSAFAEPTEPRPP